MIAFDEEPLSGPYAHEDIALSELIHQRDPRTEILLPTDAWFRVVRVSLIRIFLLTTS